MNGNAAVAEWRATCTPPAARIRRIQLTNFRSYRAAVVTIDRAVSVVVGPNGAGKTNLLEAISLLTPGRGLRRATLQEIGCVAGDGTWSVSAEVDGAFGVVSLGTGFDRRGNEEAPSRKCRIDGEGVASAAAFAEHLRIVWLLPAMDGLFSGPASERRRFLDRLVLAVDPAHGSRVATLERSLRSRNRVLAEPRPNAAWLDAIERETAALAIAVAAARTETVSRLSAALARHRDPGSVFPSRIGIELRSRPAARRTRRAAVRSSGHI
jgi:DNA replication and repair protein RecF